MRPSILIPLIAGLAAGVFALWMLLDAFQKQKAKIAQPEEMATVVVTSAEIPYATQITADMIKEVRLPRQHPFQHALASKDDVVERVTALRLAPGTPILSTVLAPEGTPPGAQHQIPTGMRTVSVDVDANSVQHLEPSDHVDVLYASNAGPRGMREMVTILANVEVFSVGDKRPGSGMELVDPNAKKGRNKSTRSAGSSMRTGGMVGVQLLLSPERAKKLSTAVINGEIQLHPRPFGDSTVVAEADLFPDDEPAPYEASITAEPEPKPVIVAQPKKPEFKVVKVLQGGDESEAKFQVGEAPEEAPSTNNGNKPSSPRASQGSEGYVPDLMQRAERSDKRETGE